MITLSRTPLFDRTVRIIVLNSPHARTYITQALILLKTNPFAPRLKTERVLTKTYKLRWSSVVKDDMRIIWDFSNARQTRIVLLTIGGSKEPLKVYRNRPKKGLF